MAATVSGCGLIADYGLSITGRAQEVISGGQLCKLMSGEDVGAAGTYATAIEVGLANAAADIPMTVGVATNTAASGEDVTVALEGIVRLTTGGNISDAELGNRAFGPDGTDACAIDDGATDGSSIGIILSTAASGEYVLIKLGRC